MNAPSKITLSTFEAFWRLGYRRLVPVVPPAAEISERSSLFKRIGTSQDGRGKTSCFAARPISTVLLG
jgi:hypothetical protein